MAIFPPGAGIVKGTAIVPLTRSRGLSFQICEKFKVNVAMRRRQQIHYLRQHMLMPFETEALTEQHYPNGGQCKSGETLVTSMRFAEILPRAD